jgi:hypothetical protein
MFPHRTASLFCSLDALLRLRLGELRFLPRPRMSGAARGGLATMVA